MSYGTVTRRDRATAVALVATLLVLATALWREAGSGRPMSSVDEHMHLDTHARVAQGSYPHRGSLMTMKVVREWACGVGHEAGAAMAPCEHPDLGPQSLPSGVYTTGYIHYPTYFVAAEGYHEFADAVGVDSSFVDRYRHFAALTLIVGLIGCLAAGWRLGFRGSALLAATFAPSASAGILLYGTIANPQSAAILMGALIGWSGLRWVTTGRGFWWLAAATALAAGVAVVHSLPAGAFMVAAAVVLVARRAGWTVRGPWQPRAWQLGILALLVVAPVLIFGRWLEGRATVANEVLFSFAVGGDWHSLARGAVWEFSVLHTPWYETPSLGADPGAALVRHLVRASIQGWPLWITIFVFGTLATVAGRAMHTLWTQRRQVEGSEEERRVLPVIPLLIVSTLLTMLLYPPALRVSNGLNMGFDYPIVPRYSIPFTPLLVWLFLIVCRDRPLLTRLLAALATIGSVSIALAIW